MKTLDMRGQACPIPVVAARRALREGEDRIMVMVDNQTAVENIQKMAIGEGYGFACENNCVILTASGQVPPEVVSAPKGGAAVMITGETFGRGDDALGQILMKGFLFALMEWETPPGWLIFLNGGAKLTMETADTLKDLKYLEEKGTQILTCGTCADYFAIKKDLAVGKHTDMFHISQILSMAERVITL